MGRIALLFILLFSFDWYIFSALKVAISSFDPYWTNLIYTIYWAIPVLTIGSILTIIGSGTSKKNSKLLKFLQTLIYMIYFAKLLTFLVLFADDIRRIVLMLFAEPTARSIWLAKFALLFGIVPLVVLSYGILRNTYRFKVVDQLLSLDGLPDELDGLKIIQLSDIHVGSFNRTDKVESAIENINKLKPDIVFFTGDLVNSIAAEMNGWVDIFGKIQAKYGVYSIVGNHDYGDYTYWPNKEAKRANFKQLKEIHAEMGWKLLMNENAIVEIEGCKLAVVGVENYSANKRFHKYGDLPKAAIGTEEADFKVLLSHDPSHWSDQVIKEFQDIRITFSGHTHGFQFGIDLPWFKWSPSQYVYKQWAGLYEESGQYLYVNRGFGVLGYPGRIGVLPEITMMRLNKV